MPVINPLIWPRNGFTPVARTSDASYVRNFPAQASTNQTIGVGDAVAQLNGVIVPCTAGQDPALRGFGIVMNVYTTANRPLTQFANRCIASGGVGRVDVCYDPNAEYIVRCEASVGPSNIGKNVTLVASGQNTLLAQGNQSVTIPASASINDLFRIIDISPFGELGGPDQGGGAGNGVIVRWNFHALHASVAGQ
jgi:hypothetical protein